MKKTIKFISSLLILTALVLPASPAFGISSEEPNAEKGFFVLDSDLTTPLPHRYRTIENLNISGSAQFVPSQIKVLKRTIDKPDIYIVDLRQETHGFLNDFAVSSYSPLRLLNNGFSSEDTIASELNTFEGIKKNAVENIYNKRGRLLKTVTVQESQIEQKLVENNGMNYILFATRDGHIPTPAITDSFVNFVKITPKTTHLHFHCDAGEGRTTSFMAMFQMMKESSSKSLEEILNDQFEAGGIILTNDQTRAEFLRDFYDYTKENSKDNFKVPFSVWSAENSKSMY